MHESLVRLVWREIGKILSNCRKIIHFRVRIQRSISIAMNEILHSKVLGQPNGASVFEMLPDNAFRITVQREEREQTESPEQTNRDEGESMHGWNVPPVSRGAL